MVLQNRMTDLTSSNDRAPPLTEREDNVVILVHGIRDYALRQSAIRATLREAGFVVEPTNYGRFNIFQFLTPIPFFRRWAINQVREQIRIVKKRHPSTGLSIIARGLGTYVVA
jgi:hypothetical protein